MTISTGSSQKSRWVGKKVPDQAHKVYENSWSQNVFKISKNLKSEELQTSQNWWDWKFERESTANSTNFIHSCLSL